MHLIVTADVPLFLYARLLTDDRASENKAQHQLLSLVKSSLYELRVPSSSRMI